jgi:hypothetical protein
MKHYKISEIIYWVISIISIFSFFENWGVNNNRAYDFSWLFLFFRFLWLYLEDILEKNIQIKIK